MAAPHQRDKDPVPWLRGAGCRIQPPARKCAGLTCGDEKDAVLVFSVGGGGAERNVSPNIVRALDEAKARGMRIFGVVGRDGGYTKKVGDVVVVVPTIENPLITPLTEAFQAVVRHGLVSHPALQIQATKWEGLERP